ncbi:MAG: nucleotide-binding protein [Candidatus Micrarchaeota archaeon]|nr:nucleotide-binding protein [Candidatus Micrarchaeota archaeon]
MRKVLLDTNFLLLPFERKIDLVSGLRRIHTEPITIIIPQGAISELSTLSKGCGRKAAAARLALKILPALRSAFPLEIVAHKGAVDEWILKYAQKNHLAVATNDAELRKKLSALRLPLVVLKSKAKIDYA